MVISRALEYSLNNETFAEGPDRYIPRPAINYENNTVFSRFFEVILPYDGECFIPVLGLSHTLRYIQSWLDSVMNIDRTSRTIHIIKPVCYISPVVFENNDLLSKAIIKKVIPYLSTCGILAPTIFRNYNVLYNYDSFWHVPISIKYINDYFICPVEPTIIESLDDSIWSFLRENVNDLV